MAIKSSIDQEELSKFSKDYSQWWDQSGEFKMLHQINPIRIDYITSKIKQWFDLSELIPSLPLKGLKLLDVGSGGGLISVPMHQLGAKVTGLDANEQNIKAAKKHANENKLKIKYINTTVEQHVLSSEKYDVILCLEVLEHVSNPGDFLLNLADLLADGGIVILSTINRTVKSYLLAIVAAEYVLRWIPVQTHDYSKFLKPSEIVTMLQKTDLKIGELKGLTFSLCDQKWRLSDDIDVNYFAVFTKPKVMYSGSYVIPVEALIGG